MKMRNRISHIWLAILVLGVMLLLYGCGSRRPQEYGQEISNRTITKLDSILKTPGNFDGKTVTVQGRIVRECPTGCWFEVKDQAGIIYVDLNPSGFAIPQKVGKKVVVEGKVLIRSNQPMLVGTGVEIK